MCIGKCMNMAHELAKSESSSQKASSNDGVKERSGDYFESTFI